MYPSYGGGCALAGEPATGRPINLLGAAQPLGYSILSGLLVAAFYLFPVAHTRWGDAYMLTKGIAYPDLALRLTHSWQAPLDVFLHGQVWLALHAWLHWEDAMPAYRLLSPLAGALYLGVVLALSRNTWLAPPWLTYGLLATLGLMQLFFGYVENYSFAAGVLAYLWLGLGVLKGRRPLWLAAAVLAVTNATHPSTVILAPSLVYLGWCGWRRGATRQLNQSSGKVVSDIPGVSQNPGMSRPIPSLRWVSGSQLCETILPGLSFSRSRSQWPWLGAQRLSGWKQVAMGSMRC